jgi:hypothetical protein
MNRSRRHEAATHLEIQDFGKAERRPNFYKKALIAVSYVTASAIVALGMAYWPAAAGSFLGKLNITPVHLTSASDVPNRIHKANRLSGISFQERWSAVPVRAAETSRRGNFSTRCIAGLDGSKTLT